MKRIETGDKRIPASFVSSPLVFMGFILLLLAIGALTVFFRIKGLTFDQLPVLFGNDRTNIIYYTVWNVRVPRLLLAILLGSLLAIAGSLLQLLTHNPLSDPEIMGINQGASCFAVLAILLFGDANSSLIILAAAFVGAAMGGGLIYLIAFWTRTDPSRLVLAGVAISAFMGALTTGIILLQETQLTEILYWMAGKLSGAGWIDIKIVLFCALPAAVVSLFLSNTLNVFAQGEEIASGLGVNVIRIRRILIILVVLVVGSAVAVAGPIGFVGLIVPHMARRLVGLNHRVMLPMAALLGANLLVAADFTAQWISYPADIPVGIITAFLGVPFFLYLLRSKKGAA